MVKKLFRIKSFKTQKPIIKLDKISMSFGKRQILDNISIDVQPGQIMGLLGPNGAGKSTIFNLIVGNLKPDYGSIIINSKNVNDTPIYSRVIKHKIAMVPQSGGFFWQLTAEKNLETIGEILIPEKKLRFEKINSLIAKFELESLKDVPAINMSGGQQRRLCIALALLGDPKILLLDEPFSALDIRSVAMLQDIIIKLQYEFNISVIISDHAASALLQVSDFAVILSECKIVAHGSPAEVTRSKEAKVYFGDSFKIS